MKTLILLDVCTPGYFTGHSLPAIEVLVDADTTVSDLIEGIEREYNFNFDLYEDYYEVKEFEKALAKFKEDNAHLLSEKFLKDYKPEPDADEQDSIHAYFVLGKFRVSRFGGVNVNTVE